VQLANAPLHQTLIFKAGLPTFNAPESLAHFQVQAPHLDFGNLTRSPLELSRFDPLNLNIARALDMIVPHALATEHFVSEDQQNLFIAKLLLLIDTYVANVDFSKPEVPKAIFYGPIKRQECYFILLLAAIGFDTFYLNPTHDVTFGMIDTLGMSQTLVLGDPASFEDFDDLAASGVVIDHITTAARHAADELDAFMYTDSGLFRPWQFTKGTT
ncbi:MAG: YceG family protein, partial [Niameybacter sp.]